MRVIPIIALFFLAVTLHAQTTGKAAKSILSVMDQQEKAWNKGDLSAFMEGYWKSDSLCFIGSRGLTHGWTQTLENYKKGYPNTDAMGQLKFTIVSVEQLSKKSAYVIGKWQLTRTKGDIGGHYTLLWKKIKGKWVIVADHSS
jgi:ketosteroid isomerase-like protein